jgi:hypothetical protein
MWVRVCRLVCYDGLCTQGGGGALWSSNPESGEVGSDSIRRKQKQMGANYLSHESSFCSFPMLVERVRALNSAATTWLIASSSLSFS